MGRNHTLHGILLPSELSLLAGIFKRITAEPWFSSSNDDRDEFARFLLMIYSRGMVIPDKLEEIAKSFAESKYYKKDDTRAKNDEFNVLLVEDDYLLAREGKVNLSNIGAEVIGPVGTVADALEIVEHSSARIDAAILDINLHGQLVFPVAGFLKMQQIPFIFISGYNDLSIPPAFRNVPRFSKPADWKLITKLVASPQSSGQNP